MNSFFQAFEDGYLSVIYTPEGGTAEVGATVAVIVDSVGEVGKSGDNKPTATASSTTATAVATSAPSATTPASSISSDKFEKVDMPALSSTMKEGRIVSWSKKIGDKVSVGDVLLVVESDKADMDVEAYEDGYLAVITVAESQSAEVGAPVGYLAKKKEDIEAVQQLIAGGGQGPSISSAGSVPAPATTTPVAAAQQSSPASVVNDGRVAASGYAKTVAKERGIDLSTVTPSRADQYITSRDLATGNAAPAAAYVPAAGVINATPTAKKLAAENNLDITKIKGTGNFGRVTPDDVLMAAGKLAPPAPKAAPAPAAPAAQTVPAPAAAGKSKEGDSKAVLDGVKPMDGMQKAVAKNMEKTLSVPIFRVSRFQLL